MKGKRGGTEYGKDKKGARRMEGMKGGMAECEEG
jgi:hypothetical protein